VLRKGNALHSAPFILFNGLIRAKPTQKMWRAPLKPIITIIFLRPSLCQSSEAAHSQNFSGSQLVGDCSGLWWCLRLGFEDLGLEGSLRIEGTGLGRVWLVVSAVRLRRFELERIGRCQSSSLRIEGAGLQDLELESTRLRGFGPRGYQGLS